MARTAIERVTGLRGQPALTETDGLLIVSARPVEICLTNESVTFAIDAAFATEDGSVTAVEHDTPEDDDTQRCHDDIAYVLASPVASPLACGSNDRLVIV